MLTWLLASSSLAAPDVGVIVRPEAAVDVAGDRDGEDPVTLSTWIRAFASTDIERGDRFFLEGRVQHHVYAGEDVEGWWELGLGESGMDVRLGTTNSPLRLRAGALVERWGKLDLLPVLDVLNPRDVRSGLLAPSEFQRLPIPMATLSIGNDTVRSETTLIPFPSADRLWLRETDWSPLRQGMLFDLYGEIRTWDGNDSVHLAVIDSQRRALTELDPSLRRGEDAATNLSGLPQAVLVNGEIAQRFVVYGRNLDVAVVAGALRSTFPQAVLDPVVGQFLQDEALPPSSDPDAFGGLSGGGVPVEMSWPRTYMAGLESSGLAGPLQIRGEAGFFTDRVVRLAWGDSTTLPQLGAGLGVDYVRGSALQMSLEARYQHLFEAPPSLILSAEDQVQIAAGLRAGFAAERFWLTLGGAYDVSFSELLARPSIAWRVNDNVQLELGAVILEGFRTAPPEDAIDVLTYEGGPASLWSQNDAVTMALVFVL